MSINKKISPLRKKCNKTASKHLLLRGVFHLFIITLGLYAITAYNALIGILILTPHFAAISFLGWAGIGHELFHNSVFKNRKINKTLFQAFSIITWSNYGYFTVSHKYHHKHTLHPTDLEGATHQKITISEIFFLFSFDFPAFYRRIKILILNSMGIVPFINSDKDFFPVNSPQRKELILAARMILFSHTALIVFFITINYYWLILIVNLAPFCITFFNRTLAISQHYGLHSKEEGDYSSSCRTIIMNPVLSFFYANMNYHIEHHMHPGIPYYNLPKLNNILIKEGVITNVSNGYLGTIKTLYQMGLFSLKI